MVNRNIYKIHYIHIAKKIEAKDSARKTNTIYANTESQIKFNAGNDTF